MTLLAKGQGHMKGPRIDCDKELIDYAAIELVEQPTVSKSGNQRM
jgi:hypothetical protein